MRPMIQSRHISLARRTWTAAEDAHLRTLYPDHTAAACAHALNRSTSSVYARANVLGLAKSTAFYASDRSGRVQRGRQDPRMRAHQFKPGQPAWNKGIKGSTGTHPECRAHQFKKGERRGAANRNYVPIGTLRITKDGMLERKITDDPALYPARRWVSVQRLVWEAAHGAIPPGHVVRFKPGMATTQVHQITLDRIECISMANNMRRNSVHRLPPAVAGLAQLKGAITRQVNRITQEHQEQPA